MSGLVQGLVPILAVAMIAAVAWYFRSRESARTTERTRQLNQAADYLEMHARWLGRFLEDPKPASELKELLLSFSDVMNERETVRKLTEWATTRPFEQSIDTDETKAIAVALESLRARDADLADKFDAAVISAVAGASFRWPENAKLFETAFPRLMTTPKRDVTIAVTATRLRPGTPFSVRPPGELAPV